MAVDGGVKIRIKKVRWGRRALVASGLLALGLVAFAVWSLLPFWRLAEQFEALTAEQPTRLYGRALELGVGEAFDERAFHRELELTSYELRSSLDGLGQGAYARTGQGFVVFLRSFPTPSGLEPGRRLEVFVSGGRVARLVLAGAAVERARLEPPLLASYFGPQQQDRRPVRLAEVPKHVIDSLIAAEDARFFQHPGVSPKGILRAVWVNLVGGELSQGGSTLTQQLVKNVFLSHERTVDRKVQEGILALFIEARYEKEKILEAYLNEIYLGASRGVNLMGFGSAARAYFGKDVAQLTLGEAATIAGLIPSPGRFSPFASLEVARERRNLVLDRMVEVGLLDAAVAAREQEKPMVINPMPPARREAPYFADAVAEEALQRFGLNRLEASGHVILSTLRLADQRSAEGAIEWGLAQALKSWEKAPKGVGPLQSALISIDPRNGGILAYVGGRDHKASQFDRAGKARRQAGSSFKAVVYAAAFEAGAVTPATLVEDAPLTVTAGGQTWTPQNDDKEFAGWVTVRRAMEKSLNVPTARIAMLTGLERIVELAHDMGIEAPLKPYPALALGAFEVSPRELVTVYGTLAAGGMRPSVHGIEAVLDRQGKVVLGQPLAPPPRALSRQTAFMVTSVLQGVVNHGTGAGVREQGLGDPVAGKTGTTNGRRDSWFAGYAPTRATVVWLGYDDNAKTRLSGSRAAVPIWARFSTAVRPAGGYPGFSTPQGVVAAQIDPASGGLAAFDCPGAITEYFREGQVPTSISDCSMTGGLLGGPGGQGVTPERRGFRRWLQKVFGGDDEEPKPEDEGDA
jgi:penicillin-binding protein 1B